eukprot:scaffold139_cov246-Pinguiococcus_pyrenoidosus.AAC.2
MKGKQTQEAKEAHALQPATHHGSESLQHCHVHIFAARRHRSSQRRNEALHQRDDPLRIAPRRLEQLKRPLPRHELVRILLAAEALHKHGQVVAIVQRRRRRHPRQRKAAGDVLADARELTSGVSRHEKRLGKP